MTHRFSRQELHDLAWSEPMRNLAKRLEISDTGLAKACKRADIPRPPRGYWAKLSAGKKVSRQPLPTRGPGMPDDVDIRRGGYWHGQGISEEEILASNPEPPVFEEEISDVTRPVQAMLGHVTVPKTMDRAHRQIRQLLEADQERREKQLNSRYPSSWDAPIFDDPFEKRRLRVLNAIFVALERISMKPSVCGREARELHVTVNDENVTFMLDAFSQRPDPYHGASIRTRGSSNKLKLSILSWRSSSKVRKTWEDTDKLPLEKQLDEIIFELIVAAEHQYREGLLANYDWLVERKTQLIEKVRKREEEEKHRQRERRVQLEKARIGRLLRDAVALRQAADIRAYVDTVRTEVGRVGDLVSTDTLEGWTKWAVAQADRIDPVLSGRFVESMADHEEPDEGGDG